MQLVVIPARPVLQDQPDQPVQRAPLVQQDRQAAQTLAAQPTNLLNLQQIQLAEARLSQT